MREEANNSLPPVERYKAIGNDLFKNTKFDEAIKAYTKAIDAAGENPVFDDVLIACYNNRYSSLLLSFFNFKSFTNKSLSSVS